MRRATDGNIHLRSAVTALAAALVFPLFVAVSALAGPPTHSPLPDPLGGFSLDHACGTAVDSQGDIYVASAGESSIEIFDSTGAHLASIANPNEPCGLAVNGSGELFVSERATGKVVRYVANDFPFVGSPTYGSAEPIDESGDARGIAVDPFDDLLYVAEGDHVAVYEPDGGFREALGEPDLVEATGVAAYTHVVSETTFVGGKVAGSADHYVFVADAADDQVKVFGGGEEFFGVEAQPGSEVFFDVPSLRPPILGAPGQDFGFGSGGAYLAVDPGNADLEGVCAPVAAQACTSGHLLVYDDAHGAVDEFDAGGRFLDQFGAGSLTDAEPTAMAVDRSGGENDGTIYVSSGAGPGAGLRAFGSLAAPSRAPLSQQPPSRVLASARQVAIDSHGDVYVLAGSVIHVYSSAGSEISVGPIGKGIPDPSHPLSTLAVDSAGRIYVVDDNAGGGTDETVTYYTPSAYPPVNGTTYTRHEPPIVTGGTSAGWPSFCPGIDMVAVNSSNDHVFVAAGCGDNGAVKEFDSAAPGHDSALLDGDFAGSLHIEKVSMAVDGSAGNVYFGSNPGRITVVNSTGTEVLARTGGVGSPTGNVAGANTQVAVDESNGHVLAFDSGAPAAQEYDASGAFVAEFVFPEPQAFSRESAPVGIAIDNSAGPAAGRVYIAYDDPKPNTPDLWAFAPLSYGEPPVAATGLANGFGGGGATLNGTANPRGFILSECRFEYLTDAEYLSNGKTFAGASTAPCAESFAQIGAGTAPVPVHASVTGLNPAGRYRFRLVIANKYGSSQGAPALFGPPEAVPGPTLSVGYGEAVLRASVDTSGLPAQYRFDYGTSESYGASTAVGELAPADGPVAVQSGLTGLAEGTTYHYRLVAENDAGTAQGPDQTFTTLERMAPQSCANSEYRTGLSAKLPDCRAYELVTPAETNGLTPGAGHNSGTAGDGFNNWLVTPRGADAGERVSYFTLGTLPGFDGNGLFDGYRAQRDVGEHPAAGWTSTLFGPSYDESPADFSHSSSQLGVASDQLYSFWRVDPALELSQTLEQGTYLRTSGGFEPLGRGVSGGGPVTDLQAEANYIGPAGLHVIFSSKAHLSDSTPPQGTRAIYERAAGSAVASPVSTKPSGGAFGAGEEATYVAASEDGASVLFRVGGTLFLHRLGQTVEIVKGPNTFAGVSEDGSLVFYAATASGDSPASLFACAASAGSCAGGGANPPLEIAPNSVFVNVSPDGSKVFFTSKEVLTGSEANEAGETGEAGERNLYSWDFNTHIITFLGQLDLQDFEGFNGAAEVALDAWTTAINPGQLIGRATSPTRTTPTGEVFLFQSHAKLTAYDNEEHGEIYRYAPAAEAGERLICVSCDPSAAAPTSDAMLEDNRSEGSTIDRTTMIANLTDDGQLVFFHSRDRLLPEDSNSVTDVYEWKAKGAGGCRRTSGCLALISSGQGESDSLLYGMSADGRDVLFRTREKLVGSDVPGSSSLYDARVGGGIPEPVSPAACQGDACQPASNPPPVLPSPSSSSTSDGNVGKRPHCPKRKHRVKGRCVAKHRKHKRKLPARDRERRPRGDHGRREGR